MVFILIARSIYIHIKNNDAGFKVSNLKWCNFQWRDQQQQRPAATATTMAIIARHEDFCLD